MKNFRNLLMLAVSILALQACFSTRDGNQSKSIGGAAGTITRATGDTASKLSGVNPKVGGVSTSGAVVGTSGNAAGIQPAGNMGTANTTGDAGPAESGIATVNGEPQRFIPSAANSGMAEVLLSEIAVQKAQSSTIKAYANMMLKDHGGANKALTALAAAKDIRLPDGTAASRPASLKSGLDELSKASGKEFDQKYIKRMISDHEDAVHLFEEGTKSSDQEVRAYAAKYLPALKMHLQHARDLSKNN